jgi:hypothetical protein
MKTLTFASAMLVASLCALHADAQKVRLTEGSLAPLKGQTTINTEFTYDNMRVGHYDKEDDYIAAKKADYDKKEPGRGDNWAKAWVSDRRNRYEPKFNELFEKHAEVTVSAKSKYTLIYKTTYIEPGYNIGISRHSAEVNAEVWVVETANPSNVIAKLTVEHAPGKVFMGNDYDTGDRISESYASAGKAVGHFIRSKS